MKLTRTPLVVASLTLVSLILSFPPAHAKGRFECSGIGVEDRAVAEKVPHTVRLVFAQRDGKYLGGVEASVSDRSGSEVVVAQCPGPWILLDLSPGTYEVAAHFRGDTKTRAITVNENERQEQIFAF